MDSKYDPETPMKTVEDSQWATLLKVHLLYSCVKRESEEQPKNFFWKSYELPELEYRLRDFVMNHSVPPTTLVFVLRAERGQLLTLELTSRDQWLSLLHLLPWYAPEILDAAVEKSSFTFANGRRKIRSSFDC